MIFLGLASNYRAKDILRHLFAWGTKKDHQNLVSALEKHYDGRAYLYHTGRSALAAAFQSVLPDGGVVIVPGLTCIAVIRAVRAAGCRPVFVDIDRETLQYDFSELEKSLQATPKTTDTKSYPLDKNEKVCYNGIILAQNTLGFTLDAQKLSKLAQKYHFAIVEDLAHSAGRFYSDGREVGTVGVAAVLSFGKGKAIDVIEGGAAILRSPNLKDLAQPSSLPKLSDRLRDRFYPLFGAITRGLSHLHLEKPFLAVLLKFHWIERSADAKLSLETRLPHWQAKLALRQLQNLPKTPLRDYLLVENRTELLQNLHQKGYRLNEIWYDAPVSPIRYAKEANFPTEDCPKTVEISKQIINIPTWYPEKKLKPLRAELQAWQTKTQKGVKND